MGNGNGAIFQPIFRGTHYLHHKCSECGHKIHLMQSAYGGVEFYEVSFGTSEEIKFCPHCGSGVVRFDGTPQYEVLIDYQPLDIFSVTRREYEHKCKWLWHCYISDEHREAVEELLPMIRSDERASEQHKIAAIAAELGKRYNISHHDKKKLVAEFGSDAEGEGVEP